MALKFMQTTEMISVTRSWTDPTHRDYQRLANSPILAPLHPQIIKTHRALVHLQPVAATTVRLGEVQDEQVVVDRLHDRLVRGIELYFQALGHLLGTAADREAVEQLRVRVVPGGLKIVNASYREQVGHGEMVAAALTEADWATLARMGTFRGTLDDAVTAWLAAASRLGALDRERRTLTAGIPGRSTASLVRGRWVRMIEMVRRTVEFCEDDDRAELEELLVAVQRAEDEAIRRRARQRAAAARTADDEAQEVSATETEIAATDTDTDTASDTDTDTDTASGAEAATDTDTDTESESDA
ncbi:MAG: hypothetical protein AAGC55_33110 [Myxococcota bacterium]